MFKRLKSHSCLFCTPSGCLLPQNEASIFKSPAHIYILDYCVPSDSEAVSGGVLRGFDPL